jgi:hypothetical protein
VERAVSIFKAEGTESQFTYTYFDETYQHRRLYGVRNPKLYNTNNPPPRVDIKTYKGAIQTPGIPV